MLNTLNTTLIEFNLNNSQNTGKINLNNTSSDIIITNKSNNILSSIPKISETILENKNNSSIGNIPGSTLIKSKYEHIVQEKTSNPFFSKSTNIIPENNNIFLNNQTIHKNGLKSSLVINNNYNNTHFNNSSSDILLDKNINISGVINNTNINNTLNETNISNKTIKLRNPFFPKNINVPLINKTYDSKLVLGLGISIPIILIILIILICYYIKKKKKSKMTPPNFELNRINFKNSGLKLPYNKLQNTSNINPNMNANNISMSEIKVQNLKEEIHNIITNSSGSNSSGRRKREKKRGSKNNNKIPGYSGQQGNKEAQNEMKEQIKQYVIDEKNN